MPNIYMVITFLPINSAYTCEYKLPFSVREENFNSSELKFYKNFSQINFANFKVLLFGDLDPEETRCSPKFATRLFASSHLSEVDPACIPYLGFLPHEMLGTSVLDFYHPEDMPFLKDVYEAGKLRPCRPRHRQSRMRIC